MDSLEDYLPCYRKSEYEAAASKQLLALSSPEYPNEYGDPGYLNAAKFKKIREKGQPAFESKEEETWNKTEEKSSTDSPALAIWAASGIYERLGLRGNNSSVLDFCGWQLCPSSHAETVKYGIVDASRLKPKIRKFNLTNRNINSAVGKLSARVSTSPSKLKTCLSSRLDHQRLSSLDFRPSSSTSSSKREELGVWQEPPPLLPIQYSFKYLKHPRQYLDQYREVYTYSKMREKNCNRSSFITGVVVPRARLRCVNDRESRGKAIINAKSVPPSTPTNPEADRDKTSATNWQLNKQLLETCDVELSVNNPSPTEIAMLSKIPNIHHSSPSIPSNTNGKYGGKGTDKPYPFQLNISADAQTVIAPSVKKVGRTVCIH